MCVFICTRCVRNKYNNNNNMSDHLPRYMYINLPINIMHVHDVRQFIPKPKWTIVNNDMLLNHKCTLDMSIENIVLQEVTINSKNARCTRHEPLNQKCHNEIIVALLKAAKVSIHFTGPKSYYDKSQHVAIYRKDAIN